MDRTSCRVTGTGGPVGVNFGNRQGSGFDRGLDYGDAPSPFPTTIGQDGASHGVVPGFHLGPRIDGEPNGQPTSRATGDDNNGFDEDGVLFSTDLIPGGQSTVQVVVANGGQSAGLLQAWIDFDHDGAWTSPGEQIFRNQTVREGINSLTFTVPTWAIEGETFARFRYGYERDLSFHGSSLAGEVEDHIVDIVRGGPIAVDDQFTVRRNSEENPLDVMANDNIRAGTGTIIASVTQPNLGGLVTISSDKQSVFYTPPEDVDGTESFTYTLRDNAGITDTASVQVVIPPDLASHSTASSQSGRNPHYADRRRPGIPAARLRPGHSQDRCHRRVRGLSGCRISRHSGRCHRDR